MKSSSKNNKNIITLWVYILAIFVAFFFFQSMWGNMEVLKNTLIEFDIKWIVASLLVIIIAFIYSGILWRTLIKNNKIPYSDILYIHSISWLAKYIPWKVTIILSKIFLLSKYGISKKQGLVASIYENIFQLLAALIVSIPIILYHLTSGLSDYYLYISVSLVIGFIIFIHPTVFYWSINLGLRLFRKEALAREYFLETPDILKNILWYSIYVILNGIGFFLMIQWITTLSWDLIIPTIGIWNFAGVIWLLAIFAPAGIGVREWILIVLLNNYLPIEVSVLISLFSRLWTTIFDGIIGLYICGYKWMKRPSESSKDRIPH